MKDPLTDNYMALFLAIFNKKYTVNKAMSYFSLKASDGNVSEWTN